MVVWFFFFSSLQNTFDLFGICILMRFFVETIGDIDFNHAAF